MGWFGDGTSYPCCPLPSSSPLNVPHIEQDNVLTIATDSDQAQAHDQIVNSGDDNRPEFTHELAAGGAAFFAAREYEKHCDANGTVSPAQSLRPFANTISSLGKPQSHQEAKELVAGFAGAFADREIEPRMENAYDRRRIQDDAVQQCNDQGETKIFET
jgi:Protein of unknown function (DUF3759)